MATFESNLSRLLSLKKEAHLLTNTYSRDLHNVAHLTQLEQKTLHLKNTHLQLEALKHQHAQALQALEAQLKLLAQKHEATNIEYLMAQQALDAKDLRIEQLTQALRDKDHQLRQADLQLQDLQAAHQKQLENQRLMHNQELYILKRKK